MKCKCGETMSELRDSLYHCMKCLREYQTNTITAMQHWYEPRHITLIDVREKLTTLGFKSEKDIIAMLDCMIIDESFVHIEGIS